LLVSVSLLVDLVPFCAGFMKFDSSSELNYFSGVHSSKLSGSEVLSALLRGILT